MAQLDFTLATAAVSQLKAQHRHIGPYLMGGVEGTVWWLLPLGTGYRLIGTDGVAVQPVGQELLAPPPDRCVDGRAWVFPDRDRCQWRTLTSSDDLREALDAAHPHLTRRAPSCP